MPQHAVPLHILQESVDAFQRYGNKQLAADKLGLPVSTLKDRLRHARFQGLLEEKQQEFQHTALPDPDMPIEQLVAWRKQQFARKAAYEDARRLIKVKVKIEGPVGIWHFGDPHIDDDGTDIAAIEAHTALIQNTPGLFGANVGDTTNNWAGRLSHLWSQQSTTHKQAWKLAEWFLERVKWLYLIKGNHDAFHGDGDPINWIKQGDCEYASEVRLELNFPNKNICRVNARHDFAGHSMYNPAHGPMKASMMGVRDHLNVCGHKHICGHGFLKNPDDGCLCHSLIVAGYKRYDRYAMERGFRDQHVSPGVFTLINPQLPNTHPDFIEIFWSIEEGVDFLNYKRSKK